MFIEDAPRNMSGSRFVEMETNGEVLGPRTVQGDHACPDKEGRATDPFWAFSAAGS